jgi:hypothetical protein
MNESGFTCHVCGQLHERVPLSFAARPIGFRLR